MKVQIQVSRFFLPVALLGPASGISSFAQNGKLFIRASPEEVYVFVDDHAISEASEICYLKLSAGEHKIELVNYGYEPSTQTVTIQRA